MTRFFRALLVGSVSAALSLAAPLTAFAESNRTTYIVMPKEGQALELRGAISALGEFPEDQLTLVDDLFIIDLLPEDAAKLSASEFVSFIEADAPITTSDTQSPTPSWGLDRIDGVFDNSFSYPNKSGSGVRVYVFDTGVAGNHPDLIGRVTQGFDVIGSNQANTDCHYHGTHVAGTIAGTSFGLAKNATVVPIRVLGCTGSGSTSGILRAINWVIANHPSGVAGVANMSLGGGRNLSFNAAIASLVDRGIATVVAAGNSRADACTASPASAPEAITVGATDRFDNRASFSNFGECVDIFAPGVSIPSADARNFSTPVALSGTSMASPHVAGVAALILGESPAASTEQVEAQIYALSQPGVVKNALTDRGNRMAVSPPQNFTPIPTLPGAPAGLRVLESGAGFVKFGWNKVEGAKSYQVEFRKASQNAFTLANAADESFSVTNLSGGEVAFIRVRSVTDSGTTKFSSIISGKSAVVPPSEARGLTINATSKNSMVLSWINPVSLGGASSVQYRVEMKTTGNWMSINTGPQTSVSISDMRIPHSFRVFAFNEAGLSAPTAEVTFDPSLLFGVTSVTSSAVTGRTAVISWISDAPASSSFEVRLARTNGSVADSVFTTSANPFTISGLVRLSEYRVTVTPLGILRGFGSSTTFTTTASAPDAPRALSTVKQTTGYLLRFAAGDNGGAAITSYRLEQLVDNAWVGVQTGTSSEFTVADPARGQSHDFRLIAINSMGESAASQVLRVTTPAQVSSAPQSFSASVALDGRVNLSWQAPADDGGAPVTQYRIEFLRDGVWSLHTTLSNLSVSLAPIAKGVSVTYRVVAVNRAGQSPASSAIEVYREKTVPSSVVSLNAQLTSSQVVLMWAAVSDNGGSALLGYRVQQRIGTVWTDVTELLSGLSVILPGGQPGESRTYRVLAFNELGSSVGGFERTVVTPFLPASAPSSFSYQIEPTRIKFTWERPISTGGSDLTQYVLSSSSDGTNFRAILTFRATDTVGYLNNPTWGSKSFFRLQAVTRGFGNGQASEVVEASLPAIAPADPRMPQALVKAGEGILLSWLAPSFDGGAPVTSYRIELRVGTGWSVLGETTSLSYLAPLGKAGETMQHRVLAVNAAGSSVGNSSVTTRMGIAPATPPQSLSATVVARGLQLSWVAPETMGGTLSYYQVQRLTAGVFQSIGITGGTSLITQPPSPGQSATFRVVAFTNAGMGAFSSTIDYLAPKVVPTSPSSFTLRSSGLVNTLTWSLSGVNSGGGSLDKAILYRQQSGNWVKVAEAAASSLSLTFENNLFGASHVYTLRLTNEVGESINSRSVTLRHAFAPTSQATNLTLTPEGTRLRLSWTTPTFIGGSAPTVAEVQVSDDGTTWRRAAFVGYTTSLLVSAPAKGRGLSYRVVVVNGGGGSLPSEAVRFENPLTAPSSNFSVSASRSGDSVVFRVFAPSDFGGYSSLSMRIEQQGTLAWQSSDEYTLSSPGGSMTIRLKLPAARGTYTYRVAIANPSGEVERTVSFRY